MAAQTVLPSREVTIRRIGRIGFGMYTHEEIMQISVKRLTNPVTLDTTGRPLPDGLYDPALGLLPNDRSECETCGLGSARCPGHFGHVELPVPVYNPLLIKELYQLLKSLCFHCFRLRLTHAQRAAYERKLYLLLQGRLFEASGIVVAKRRGRRKDDDEDDGDGGGDVDTPVDSSGDEGPSVHEELTAAHAAAAGLNSAAIEELQKAMAGVFGDVAAASCPHCGCIQPKVKRVGKAAFMLTPLSARQVAKNEGVGISLTIRRSAAQGAAATGEAKDGAANGDKATQHDDSASATSDSDSEAPADELQPAEPAAGDSSKRKRSSATAAPKAMSAAPVQLTTAEVHHLLSQLWAQDHALLNLLFQAQGGAGRARSGASHAAMFFVRAVLVPPNKFRPFSVMNEVKYEHVHNVILVKVLKACLDVHDLHGAVAAARAAGGDAPDAVERFLGLCRALQNHVAQLIDSTASENKDSLQGVRQLLEKKEGLFRSNMMGKRVNFAARSVISPDPYIGTGEIGVPPFFASRLSFPEPVTQFNHAEMRQLVLNGAEGYPGAVAVEDPTRGVVVSLANKPRAAREAIAKQLLTSSTGRGEAAPRGRGRGRAAAVAGGTMGRIVYRHLRDGDILLTNRQPTLHKPGLMAHRARVLHGERTIRFHYANCATFNADFDGDEINLHLPQEQQGRAEGRHIVHADHQFKVPTDGKPVRGLIQDHVIGAVELTKRGRFLGREDFLRLVSVACGGTERGGGGGALAGALARGVRVLEEQPIDLPPPAILKPAPLWTGKQVVNTLLAFHTAGMPPATFAAKAKVTAQEWGVDALGSECLVHVRRGYLCHGTLDKAQYGGRGLLHACQELYGGPVVGAITSALSRLFTTYVQMLGFTCGMRDLLLTPAHEAARAAALARAEAVAVATGGDLAGVALPAAVGDAAAGSAPLRAAERAVRAALRPRYRQNARMGEVHDQRCSSALNPVASAVTKACFPGGLVRPFQRNCMSLMTTTGAKGGLVNFSQISAMLGQQDLEGRRVPRTASGKTLPAFQAFDAGARSCGFIADRFLTGLRPQEYYFHCMAGRDGLVDTAVKTARSGYLQRCMIKNLEGLAVAYDATVRDDADAAVVQFAYGEDGLDVLSTSYLDSFAFLDDNLDRVEQDLDVTDALPPMKASASHEAVRAAWRERRKRARRASKAAAAEPATSSAIAALSADLDRPCVMADHPCSVLGVVSDRFEDALEAFLTARGGEGGARKEAFRDAMHLRYMRSQVAAGEAVGVLAGQSIGEPSTQMTLNTFHMAGRGEANVTLGIPRLRELLMTAARRVKTPVTTLPMRAGRDAAAAEALAARLRKLRLAECLKGLAAEEVLFGSDPDDPCRQCKRCVLHLQFHAMEDYPSEAGLTWRELQRTVEDAFAKKVEAAVVKAFKRAAYSPGIETMPEAREGGGKRGAAEDSGDENAPAVANTAQLNDAGEDAEDENKEGNDEFTDAKEQGRGQDLATYDTSGDDESDSGESETSDIVAERGGTRGTAGESAAASTSGRKSVGGAPAAKRSKTAGGKMNVFRYVEADEAKSKCELHISMPIDSPKLLMLELAAAAAVDTYVREVRGVDKVFVVGGDGGAPPALQIDGLNFEAAFSHADAIDVHAITCNDVSAVLGVYGVEAARATLVREVRAVFGVYGIQVDARHLSLIGDFMTQGGGYRACSRLGIASSASPLLKMSFETSATFLKEAALRGQSDAAMSAAARIVLGQPVALGTGAVALRMDVGRMAAVA